MRHASLRGCLVAGAVAGLLAASLGTANAAQSSSPSGDDKYAPGLLRAMERDLGVSTDRAVERLDFQARAAERSAKAAKTLGSYAGSWVDPKDDVLYVAVTDDADAKAAKALGATVVNADHSADRLESWKGVLDTKLRGGDAADLATSSWYVDPASNRIVVGVTDAAAQDAVKAAVTEAGVPAEAVELVTEAAPKTLMDVVGGNAYYIGGGRCSVGFAVTDGFVSAGHCGSTGDATTSPSGTFAGSSFPGNDYAHVKVASGNTPIGAVNNYAGSTISVAGSTPAAVGATVCRSGSTTGWHCGTIQALNATVTYQEGSVNGLIRTNVCAEPGDSGGSLLAGNQAQGMTSGGSGDCTSGGTTYFQPVNEALNAYGVSLVTNGGTSTPPATEATCTGYTRSSKGSLTAGQSAATGAFTASGSIKGCLDGPSGADFDLYLQKSSGGSWKTVARGETTSADEKVAYSGTSGSYRWLVTSYSGSGAFTLGTTP